jgi:TP901 family phage tail tape measure protein
MSRNKVIFDVLADSSQYKAQMQSIAKTTDDTSKTVATAFALSAAAIGGTLTAFAKYETQLIKVGKTADISGKELDNFGKDVVALSEKIPLSTNELLELSASAAQLGVKGKDNILKFTETVAKLGTATNITGEEGSQQIARLLNITGEGVGTVDRFANVITRLGNNVAATEAEILSMASRVGKATAQFDIGTVAVLGISAALKEIGIEAELGGSAIGRAFFSIQDAVFKGGAALETFSAITGKSGAELKTIFEKDATQAFQLFIDGLHKLPADQVAGAMSSMGLEGVRLIEVIGTLAKRSELLSTNLGMANDEAIKQTALNQEFNRAVVSLENSFKFMTTEVVNLAASLGKDLAPAASELIKDITSMIKGIRDFNEATGGAVTTALSTYS